MKRFFRILSLILCCSLLLSGASALVACRREPDDQPNTPPNPVPPNEGNNPPATDGFTRVEAQETITDCLTLHGRTYIKNDALMLFWTYSGFSLRFEGTGVTAKLTTNTLNPSFPGFLCIYVDGNPTPANTVKVKNGSNVLIEGLTPGVHTIEVRKRNEAVYGESATIGVRSLTITDGCFIEEAPEEPELQIEFIGDSITSGFGNMVTNGSGASFTTLTQDGTMTYATLAGRALGADIHVLSRSGLCYVTNTNKDSIAPYYDQVAALPGHPECTEAWDFDAEASDVVVINLGTNDSGAQIGGGQITPAQMQEQAVDFLHMVREKNPDAIIVWAYGMMDNGRGDAINNAVRQVNDDGDYEVYYLPLPVQNTVQNGVGVHTHPSIQSHILAAEVLSAKLSELLVEPRDGRVLLEAQIRCIRDYRLTDTEGIVPAALAAFNEQLETAEALLNDKTADEDALLSAAQALREALLKLPRADEMSDEYIVIDTCDKQGPWQLNGSKAGLDTEEHLWGEGCFVTTGTGDLSVNFMQTSSPYGIPIPADLSKWYLEMWAYIDDPSVVNGSSCVEISKEVDKIEFAFPMTSLNLQEGWNHLVLPINSSSKTALDRMDVLNYVRIFWRNLPHTITFRVDDIVLTQGKYAADTSALSAILTQAEAALAQDEDNEALVNAIALAKAATTQRSVDLAAEKLEKLLK